MSGKYTTFHKTVLGHLHILKGIPCEDYSASFSEENGRYQIAIVADGHGDSACMRSAYGSQAVTEVAQACLEEFAQTALQEGGECLQTLAVPKQARQTIKQLTDTIISQWYERVDQHLKENPLTEEEYASAGRYEKIYREQKHLEHIYGTTLIAALMLPDYLILIHQGDGRCDVFYEDGSVDQPIPWDDRCFENIVTSMCDDDVVSSIRHCIIPLKERRVIACYMGSDGVEDSYRDMEGTHTFYRNLSGELVRRGKEDFLAYLEEMLPSFSSKGSGDDVSVAGIVDVEAIKPFLPAFAAMAKHYELSESSLYYSEKLNSMARKHSILRKRVDEARTTLENAENRLALERKKKQDALLNAERMFQSFHQNFQAIQQEQGVFWDFMSMSKPNFRVDDSVFEALEAEIDAAQKKYQAACDEFEAYDQKYQAIQAKQKELQAQMDQLFSQKQPSIQTEPEERTFEETGETEEPEQAKLETVEEVEEPKLEEEREKIEETEEVEETEERTEENSKKEPFTEC